MNLASVIVLAAGLSVSASAQPTTWDGDAGDGLWISQQNWDTDTVPSGSSQVMIPSDAGNVQISLSSENCSSLDCLSSFQLTSGSIAITGSSNVSNMIFDGGGFTPTVDTGGLFTISGNSSCNVGQVTGTGSFSNAGIFDAMGFGVNDLNGSNSGTWNMQPGGGWLELGDGVVFTNSGTINLTADSQIQGEQAIFINSGTMFRNGGVGTTTISSGYSQTAGLLSVFGNGAVVSLNSDAWDLSGGSLVANGGGRLMLFGTDLLGTRTLGVSDISGHGTVDLFPLNATINWTGTTTTSVTNGGFVSWAGTINLTGAITNTGVWEGRGTTLIGVGSGFTNTAGATLLIPSGNGFDVRTALANSGTVDVLGSLFTSQGARFVHSFGKIKLQDQSVIGTLTPENHGLLWMNALVEINGSASGAAASISAPIEMLEDSGFKIENGSLFLSGGGIINSLFSTTLKSDLSSAFLLFYGGSGKTYTANDSFSVNSLGGANAREVHFGVINAAGPEIVLDASGSLIIGSGIKGNLLSSNFSGSGTLWNEGDLYWFGGSLGCKVVNDEDISIQPGIFGKILKAELKNNLFGSVFQGSSISLDGGTIVNKGVWDMHSGASINTEGSGGTVHNELLLNVVDVNGQSHGINVDFNNTGRVHVIDGHLAFTGSVLQLNQTDGTLSGGDWDVDPGSSITFPRSLFSLRGPATLKGGSSEFPDLGSLEKIEGAAAAELLDTVINGDLNMSQGSTLKAKGNVTINGKLSSTGGSITTIDPGAKIEATGGMEVGELDSAADEIHPIVVLARIGMPSPSIVTTLLELWGGIRVGETGTSLVEMDADVVVYPTGRVHVNVLGTGPGTNTSDQLAITGAVTLGGTLLIDASQADFTLGQTLTVLSATGGITGMFDDVQVAGLGLNQTMTASIVGNEVRITASTNCSADFTNDGVLDFFDIAAFLTAFSANDPTADLSGDGQFDFFDIAVFLTAFGAGCP